MPLLFPDGFLSLNGDMNIETDKFGNKYWFLNGELHREGGPAIDGISGSKEWFLNGKRHREDGPAVERDDGSKECRKLCDCKTFRDYTDDRFFIF